MNITERQNNENIVVKIWAKYFPYWPIFLLLMAMGAGGAWLYLQLKQPVYNSNATLLIKDEKKGIEDSKMSESLNMLSNKKIIENETEVIKSRALMSQLVNQLKLYAPVFQVNNWIVKSAYSTSPIGIEVKSPDSLIENKKINFNYNADRKEVNIDGHQYPLNQWNSTAWGDLRFSTNNQKQTRGDFYFALINPRRVTEELIRKIEVLPSGKLSSIINLSLKGEVPQRSEDILNTLISEYDKSSLSDKNILAEKTLSFLDERLNFISKSLDSIEKQLQQYKSRNGAIDLSTQGKLFLQNVSDNDQKLSEVNMKLAVLKNVEQYVSSNDNKGGLVPSTLGIDDPQLSNLLNKLYEIELKYEKLKATTGKNNQEMISLTDQIEKIKPNVLDNIHSQQKSLESIKRNLFSTNTVYSSSLNALPQQERDLIDISREQNIKSTIYSFLLQKREETALSSSSILSDTKLIDKAYSSIEPVSLDDKIIYAIAILLSVAIGFIIITARELFNGKILFRQEIESMTSLPVIGEIALEKSKSQLPLVIEDGKGGFIAEEFRLLRTSLFYLGIGSGGKNILVTSTIPGEGKSFVALNLAMSLALSGKKIVLVEFDLSNPTLAIKLGITGGVGVADYLTGEAEAEDIIRKSESNPNLFLATAGTLPHNPSELILQDRTVDLLNYLKNKFDYVVIDSAPVGLLSNGYVLSRYCDATLYVVRHKYTPKKMLERLEENNKINELKNLAIVFNGVRARGFGRHGYGYGYGYGYVYGRK